MNTYHVYILGSLGRTLYIGVTNNLMRRILEHKNKECDGFTKKYSCTKLLYFEESSDVRTVIEREKQLKNWNRKWKIELIEKSNSEWRDLSLDLFE